MSTLKNAILEGVLSAVRTHPGVTLGQLGDPETLGFDLRAVPVSRLLGKNTTTSELLFDVSGLGDFASGIPVNHKLDPTIGAKVRTKVQRENFDAAVLWVVAGSKLQEPDENTPPEAWLWSAIEIGDSLAERGHGNATPDQLRKSLKRLIALKQVKQSGKARGTRYTATAKGVKAFEKMGAA
jgi:hypothetical protein